MILYDFSFEGGERSIFRDFFDELWGGGKLEKPKKLGDSNVYNMVEL